MKTIISIVVGLIIFNYSSVLGQAQFLDTTFNKTGFRADIFGTGAHNDVGNAIAIQNNGKILVAGYEFTLSGYVNKFILVRYNINGSIDNTFGNNGIDTLLISGNGDYADAIAIQPDGKILVGGIVRNVGDDYFALVRYDSTGVLDNTFSTGGIDTPFSGIPLYISSVIALPNGKILAGGSEGNGNSTQKFMIARCNANGSLDRTFANNGIDSVSVGGTISSASSMVLQNDGKIILAGNYDYSAFALARFDTSGFLDNSFGIAGTVTTSFSGYDDVGNSVLIQPDGKIVVVGFDGYSGFALARYNVNGTLDSAFGTNGKMTSPIGVGTSAVLQPNKKIIVAGYTTPSYGAEIELVRYDSTGKIDSSFGINGIINSQLTSFGSLAFDVALQNDGKIVVTGTDSINLTMIVARYLDSSLTTGILNFSTQNNSVFIYPNPIHSEATLNYTLATNEALTISLYDIQGRLVKNFITNENETSGTYKQTLNLEQFPTGSYILTLINSQSQRIGIKLIKQ